MDFFTLLVGLLLVLWSFRAWFSGARNERLPPGPVSLPIVGNLFKIGNKPNESLAQLAKTYGPLMTLKLGCLTNIVVSSATMAKEVLQTHDQAFAGRIIRDSIRVLNHHQGSIIWLPPSSRWRNLRKLCKYQIFTAQKLDANESLRRQKVRELLDHVSESAQVGRAVDIGQAAFTTTLNLLSNTIFSVDLVGPDSETGQEFKALVWRMVEEVGKTNLSDFFPILRPLDPQGIRRRMTIYARRIYKLFDEMIDQRLYSRGSLPSPSTRNNDLLDVLLDHFHDSTSEFGRPDIKALLAEIFVAGTDTTSTTLEWALAELLHNPDSMAKVQSELQENVGGGKQVEETDVARLPYLQAVVKETLRLHPPISVVPRKAETEVEICGFTIPKDAQVLVNLWAIFRDPGIWTNPVAFVPERFLGSSRFDFRGQDFELIPFGAGRRICPGMPFALRMVHLMLASLLQSFDWKIEDGRSPKDMDMTDKFGTSLHKALPLSAIPIEARRS
ncbi:geraniol 8-hydroxylase-like [Telopea speciosissima]|uniref:geraniol 8-hydroxylase-like n=1 Tax=Telopea speciosissima TaxID=54955 RepID=UPI001CC4778D|nr:geraniol 8-hydroxylase-like [Telopea speciosissima]